MQVWIAAFLQKIITGPFARVGQYFASILIDKLIKAARLWWADYQRKAKQERLKKEYQKLLDDPTSSVEDRRKKFEEVINSSDG